MKKLLVFGAALAFSLSACDDILNSLIPDPIPTCPPKDWTYIQAFTEPGGDALCDLLPNAQGLLVRSTTDPAGVEYLVNKAGSVVVVPAVGGEKVTIWIETTRPYWTLFAEDGSHLDHLATEDPDWGWSVSLLNVAAPYLGADVEHTSNSITIEGIAKASWISNSFPGFTMPTYSGFITIERLNAFVGGEALIIVRGYGIDDCSYTGFKIVFEAPTDEEILEAAVAALELEEPIEGPNPDNRLIALPEVIDLGMYTVDVTWTSDIDGWAGVSYTNLPAFDGAYGMRFPHASVVGGSVTFVATLTFNGETTTKEFTFDIE